MESPQPPSGRTTVKRLAERGRYDPATIDSILDGASVCHLGFVAGGQPYVIPTICARVERNVYIHGSPASRMLRELKSGAAICLTVCQVDGLVLARSAFHHSLNYRSVMVLGRGRLVADPAEKRLAMRALTDHVLPGRYREARAPSDKELRATAVLAIGLDEASAKVRTGPPADEAEDHDLPIWAGVVPLRVVPGPPVADPHLDPSIPLPRSVEALLGRGEL